MKIQRIYSKYFIACITICLNNIIIYKYTRSHAKVQTAARLYFYIFVILISRNLNVILLEIMTKYAVST